MSNTLAEDDQLALASSDEESKKSPNEFQNDEHANDTTAEHLWASHYPKIKRKQPIYTFKIVPCQTFDKDV